MPSFSILFPGFIEHVASVFHDDSRSMLAADERIAVINQTAWLKQQDRFAEGGHPTAEGIESLIGQTLPAALNAYTPASTFELLVIQQFAATVDLNLATYALSLETPSFPPAHPNHGLAAATPSLLAGAHGHSFSGR